MPQLVNAFTLFLSLMVEALPFLLLGVLLSGVLLLFVDDRYLMRFLPKQPILGALAGSALGFCLPVCECGNIPLARRLVTQGVPLSVAISFLLAAPTINPVVIWATWTAFPDQPEIVVWRVVLSLAVSTIVGAIFSVQSDPRPLLQPRVALAVPAHPQPQNTLTGNFWLGQPMALETMPMLWQNKSLPEKLVALLENTVSETRQLGAVLVFGSAIAAVVQVFVPREWVLSLGQGQVSSIVAMMLLAAIVSICSTVDAFFALAFASTFTTGSLLSFLVFGPMIDLKGVALMLTLFRQKTIAYIFLLAGLLTFTASLLINLYLY
ncbi:MAG: permease [Pseudanabaenaceae cyanobacterium]